jgi:hypothetical protein
MSHEPAQPDEDPPSLVRPKVFSLERLLSHTWPSTKEEAEEFVRDIYKHRRPDVSSKRNDQFSATLNEESQWTNLLNNPKDPPNLIPPDLSSFDRLLIHIDPGPAEETEDFVRRIYEQRNLDVSSDRDV